MMRKKGVFSRQVIATTHSDTLIAAVTDAQSILLLELGDNGTTARNANNEEQHQMQYGLNAAEVLLSKTRPKDIESMGLFD
jgi:hypothetical protein